jgi:hypothetical protein
MGARDLVNFAQRGVRPQRPMIIGVSVRRHYLFSVVGPDQTGDLRSGR